ncbi:MAG: DUF3842 family protein [Lachnospiraceae bacterium]|jgi:hypothetical protein|nr:DUF3842 family protein [Lachnospiraceae bacterium]
MNILVIDGQGGRMGSLIVEKIKASGIAEKITAIGTNSIATSAMLKAGADRAATGENPVIVNSKRADFIIGPIGIIAADSLLGEITPAMANAVASCSAFKILIPTGRCNRYIAGIQDIPLGGLIDAAVLKLKEELANARGHLHNSSDC